ncbi:MAG: rRNA pseudouridine synthase [Proteobacteria bacterium]|nr:rRNA pseudouridine synthase [Pseudomonadota bacterium]
MTDPVRLAKRLVELTSCSRREAELYIAGGWVMVDGLIVEEPQFMVSGQIVELHPDANLIPVEPATLLFHQPPDNDMKIDAICAGTRSADDRSGIQLLKQHFFRLTPCTPLERNASGLLVFTQDFRVSRKLLDDAATIEQEYIVEVAGELPPDGLSLLNHGLKFNGKPLPPAKVSWQNETRLRFALKGVIPGQIAHMCQKVGLEVLAMKRIRIGRVAMSKLPAGQWRYLMQHERF